MERQKDSLLVGLGGLAPGDVDGIARGSEGRYQLLELFVQVWRHIHQLDAVIDAGIGKQDSQASGPGDNYRVFPLGIGQGLEAPGPVQKLLQGVGPDDAALPEGRIVYLVDPGQGTGVGGGGPGPLCGPSGLENHDGLLLGHPGGRFQKALAVLDVLHVDGYYLGVGVLAEELQQVVLVYVALVAKAHDGRNPHSPRPAEPQDGHAHAPALGHQGHATLFIVGSAEGSTQVHGRVVVAIDVRPHDPDVMGLGRLGKLPLKLVLSYLRESRAYDYQPRHILGPGIGDDLGDKGRGDSHQHHVYVALDIQQALVTG